MAAADQHPRRPDAVQAGRRRRGHQDRARPGHRAARRRPTAARPTCSTSARASSSPTATTLKPSDFVRTFERQFTVPGPTSFYSGIVGADKCSGKKCDLSQGVVADDSACTLTIHLTAPDTEFLDKLALPFAYVVPGNTSLKLTGNNVPPGTGPYMWKSYDPNKAAVLVRNPNFKVWSKDAQPAGLPGPDHREVRPADLRGSHPGRERPGGRGVRRRRHPVRPPERAEQPASTRSRCT